MAFICYTYTVTKAVNEVLIYHPLSTRANMQPGISNVNKIVHTRIECIFTVTKLIVQEQKR